MKAKDLKIVRQAAAVLHAEGHRGVYDENEGEIFWTARDAIGAALDHAHHPTVAEIEKKSTAAVFKFKG